VTKSHRITVGPVGPLIQVGLNVGAAQAGSGRGGPPLSRNGLIDTGATRTAISDAVLRALQLSISGSTSYLRPGVPEMLVAKYAMRLNFEGHLSGNPWFDLEVVVADAASPGVDVLIGMDVLSRLVLFYEGVNGTMVLSY
jgi:hypothetical protein